jgi:hypothetical protein
MENSVSENWETGFFFADVKESVIVDLQVESKEQEDEQGE